MTILSQLVQGILFKIMGAAIGRHLTFSRLKLFSVVEVFFKTLVVLKLKANGCVKLLVYYVRKVSIATYLHFAPSLSECSSEYYCAHTLKSILMQTGRQADRHIGMQM